MVQQQSGLAVERYCTRSEQPMTKSQNLGNMAQIWKSETRTRRKRRQPWRSAMCLMSNRSPRPDAEASSWSGRIRQDLLEFSSHVQSHHPANRKPPNVIASGALAVPFHNRSRHGLALQIIPIAESMPVTLQMWITHITHRSETVSTTQPITVQAQSLQELEWKGHDSSTC